MYNAELISLSRGQSYRNVDVLEPPDFDKYSIQAPFGDRTLAFFAPNDQLIMVHPWGICLIWYDRTRRSGPNSITFDRILISGDVSYENCQFLPRSDWTSLGLPNIFHGPDLGPSDDLDQIVFSCHQGTFITHDANIVSLIKHYHRANRGVTKAVHAAAELESQRLHDLPQTMAKKINRRQKR